jgi:hypothetical protein
MIIVLFQKCTNTVNDIIGQVVVTGVEWLFYIDGQPEPRGSVQSSVLSDFV